MKTNEQIQEIEWGVMDCFVLALVRRTGVTSLYALRQEAGLEPGSVRATLEHLERHNLLTRSEPGKRRRRELAVTEAGSSLLQDSWQLCLREHPDAESVLRAAWVAWLMDGPERAASYLESMAEVRRQQAHVATLNAALFGVSELRMLSGYGWMSTLTEAHRRSGESEAFLTISRSLRERTRGDVQEPPLRTHSSLE